MDIYIFMLSRPWCRYQDNLSKSAHTYKKDPRFLRLSIGASTVARGFWGLNNYKRIFGGGGAYITLYDVYGFAGTIVSTNHSSPCVPTPKTLNPKLTIP